MFVWRLPAFLSTMRLGILVLSVSAIALLAILSPYLGSDLQLYPQAMNLFIGTGGSSDVSGIDDPIRSATTALYFDKALESALNYTEFSKELVKIPDCYRGIIPSDTFSIWHDAVVDAWTDLNVTCKPSIPKVFDKELCDFLPELSTISCDMPPVSWIENRHTLVLDWLRLMAFMSGVPSNQTARCSYQCMRRGKSDYVNDYTKPYALNSTRTRLMRCSFVTVECVALNGTDHVIVYKNVHLNIQLEKSALRKRDFQRRENSRAAQEGQLDERLSVAIVFTDGISHSQAKRMMPLTYNYLVRELGGVPMHSYGIFGASTIYNIAPLLMGRTYDELSEALKAGNEHWDSNDTLRYIWEDFSQQNYVTYYAEDKWYSTFNYVHKGFERQPTDYYLKAFWNELEYQTGSDSFCLPDRPVFLPLIESLAEFMLLHKQDRYFALSMMNWMSHEVSSDVHHVDETYSGVFQALTERGLLNNTLLIFMSDHGDRFNTMFERPIGWMEHRLPLLLLVFPAWFQRKYPKLLQAVRLNAHILSTPADLRKTILQVLETNSFTDQLLFHRSDSDKDDLVNSAISGRSFLHVLPFNRSCQTVGIPREYCPCFELLRVKERRSKFRKIAKHVVSFLNRRLRPFHEMCEQLRLKYIPSVYRLPSANTSCNHFRVVFETVPGHGLFNALVSKCGRAVNLEGEVTRLNRYGRQSYCIKEKSLMQYCYCRR